MTAAVLLDSSLGEVVPPTNDSMLRMGAADQDEKMISKVVMLTFLVVNG
jgi:hypothetical protein